MLDLKSSPSEPQGCVAQPNGLILEVLELLPALLLACSPAHTLRLQMLP